jgi:hypothetical protein
MASDELVQPRARVSRTGPKGHAAFCALNGGGSAHLGSRVRWSDGRTSNCMQATTRNAGSVDAVRLGELAGAAAMVTSVRWSEASQGGQAQGLRPEGPYAAPVVLLLVSVKPEFHLIAIDDR